MLVDLILGELSFISLLFGITSHGELWNLVFVALPLFTLLLNIPLLLAFSWSLGDSSAAATMSFSCFNSVVCFETPPPPLILVFFCS